MKNTFLFLALLWICLMQAQSPQLKVNGADSLKVRMSQMIVNVKIVGNIAYTTSEMHFTNKSSRQMEAELLFPLPEGVTVSRYAIDINGKMREAVPVNKNKGKQVFEAIEHRRVDPGLLERVEGNNFKTRIYPLIPNGERIVMIGYEQELHNLDANNLAYQITSKYSGKLDKFEVTISVLGAASKPSILNEGNETLVSETEQSNEWTHTYQSVISKSNYRPAEDFKIRIPIQQQIPAVFMQPVNGQHYFYANVFVEQAKQAKKKPLSIGLIWDVSLSCRKRKLEKEIQLLDSYFKALQNTSVTLYTLSYNFEKQQTYPIVNGDWTALRTVLEATVYDGGTRYSQVKLPAHDAYIFSTDGLSSMSDNALGKVAKPIYMINSLVSSDFAFMNFAAMQSGGELINLNEINNTEALDKMLYTSLKFFGIKDNFSVAELFPSIGTAVSGSFSIAGISLKPKNTLTLLFGYDGSTIVEKTVNLDLDSQNTAAVNIERLWAQKKIADLELQYSKNEQEIEMTGKKYGIITRNTSLIVLESIADYIAYDIVPPTELREEFDRIAKQQRESRLAQQHSNWNNIDSYYTQLQNWWNSDLKYTAPKPKPTPKPIRRPRVSRTTEVPVPNQRRSGTGADVRITGNVSDEAGSPLPGANVLVQGTTIGTQTDFNGNYTINAKRGDVLVYAFIGLESRALQVGNQNAYHVRLKSSGVELGEVVITGRGVTREKRALGYAVAKVTAEEVSETLSGKVAGVVIRGAVSIDDKKEKDDDMEEIEFDKIDPAIRTESWNPDRIYLKVLEGLPDNKRYVAYLELREAQEQNPSFYFDVANYFYDKGDKAKALLVLSNIADLGLENAQLYKSLTYILRQWEAYEDALYTANQVVKWRTHEPQSHRDLALTLEDNRQYQAAFDELLKALEINYYGEMSGQYAGVEDIILMDVNRIVAAHNGIDTSKLDPKYLNKMPVGVRIILNWNQMDTDIDLHVIEPSGEECYFGHRDTEAGARFSKDFTEGYGPEQYLLRNAMNGIYQVKTNYFGERALTESGPATVMVEIYTTKNGNTTRKLKTIQLGTVKENQNLAELTIN